MIHQIPPVFTGVGFLCERGLFVWKRECEDAHACLYNFDVFCELVDRRWWRVTESRRWRKRLKESCGCDGGTVIFSGFCHPAQPSVFVTLQTLIQPAALAFILQLITVRASARTSGSWQEGCSNTPPIQFLLSLPSFLFRLFSFFPFFMVLRLFFLTSHLILLLSFLLPSMSCFGCLLPFSPFSFLNFLLSSSFSTSSLPLTLSLIHVILSFALLPLHFSPLLLSPGPAGVTEAA